MPCVQHPWPCPLRARLECPDSPPEGWHRRAGPWDHAIARGAPAEPVTPLGCLQGRRKQGTHRRSFVAVSSKVLGTHVTVMPPEGVWPTPRRLVTRTPRAPSGRLLKPPAWGSSPRGSSWLAAAGVAAAMAAAAASSCGIGGEVRERDWEGAWKVSLLVKSVECNYGQCSLLIINTEFSLYGL